MNIKRQIETKSAIYDITNLNERQFSMLVAAFENYMYYTRHCLPEPTEGNEGELYDKLRKMRESETTVI
jgi:hypothetical protein